jgi:quercetin dioxygenase-like cupin family protein
MIKSLFLLGILLFIGCNNNENTIEQTKNTYPKMNLKNIHTAEKTVKTKLLFTAEEGKVISLQIAAGEQLKEHVSKVSATLICVSGKAVYKEAAGETALETGDFIIISKEVKHEVDAVTDSNFILVK